MSTELRGEWKLLKVWECRRCKILIRDGRVVYDHKCDIKENELIISNKISDEQKKVIDQQKIIINNQRKDIEERDSLIESQNNDIENYKSTTNHQIKTIDEQNKIIEYHNKTIESQKLVIEEQNKFIKDKTAEDQYKTIEDQKKTIEVLRRAIESQKKSIDERDMTIDSQRKAIESQKKIIRDKETEEKTKDKVVPKTNNNHDEGLCVHIWEHDKPLKGSKGTGYREDVEIDVFAKGRGRDRIIIKNGRLVKKPDDVDIIGEQTPEGFVMKGIYIS